MIIKLSNDWGQSLRCAWKLQHIVMCIDKASNL